MCLHRRDRGFGARDRLSGTFRSVVRHGPSPTSSGSVCDEGPRLSRAVHAGFGAHGDGVVRTGPPRAVGVARVAVARCVDLDGLAMRPAPAVYGVIAVEEARWRWWARGRLPLHDAVLWSVSLQVTLRITSSSVGPNPLGVELAGVGKQRACACCRSRCPPAARRCRHMLRAPGRC